MEFDVIVVGAGAMGSAAALHLARERRKTLLLEQFGFAHTRGSSHGESRIFRFAYPEVDYARLAMQCRPLWHALEAEAGEQLLIPTGGFDFADEAEGFANVDQVAASLGALNAVHETLNRSEIAKRFPQWQLTDDARGVYSPDAGVLRATRCVETMIRLAVAHGAMTRDHEAVVSLRPTDGGVAVVTGAGIYRARKVIVTAGAWVNHILAGVGTRLPVQATQEQFVYFRPRPGEARHFGPGPFTVWIHYRRDHTYGFPVLGVPGMKIGLHHANRPIDIESYTATPIPEVTAFLSDYIQRYLPGLSPEGFDAAACVYTSTPDHHFILGPLPSAPDIIVGSPCSGHGFKFAIGIGRALADLATAGATDMSVARFLLEGS